jgi:DNA/RNA-binding domain of Phe-tRNA-synthetase-like protein
MTFQISEQIFSTFPDVRVGCLFITDLSNTSPESAVLLKKISEQTEKITTEYSLDTITQVPFVARWREIYRTFGAKPSDYRSSIENLIRMALKGRKLEHINTLVDVYNFISLKYKLPIGGEDVENIKGDLLLTIATGEEPVVKLLGDRTAEKPFAGEVVYRDEIGVICRCWNWREGQRTMLTKSTQKAILVIEANCEEEYPLLETALDGMATMVSHFTGGKIQREILSKSSATARF